MATQIQFRRDTAANWTSVNPILAEGELGLETDTQKFKMGNAIDSWNDLLYATQGEVGPAGETGATGATGPTGPSGADGTDGAGVVAGGTAGQILSKIDSTDYNTQWSSSIDGNVISMQHKRNTHAGWISANPILAAGEVGFETDTGLSKTGNGTSTWDLLSWDSIAHSKQYVKAGQSINKGQAVYVSGSDGTDMIVSKASNASESTSSKTFGLMNGNTTSGGYNTVVTEGILGGLDTSAASAGDPVWLGTSGNLIYGLAGKPYAPAHLVFIGIVEAAHPTAGRIYVKIQNGFELDELHNVDLKTVPPTDGQVLAFDDSDNLWKPTTITSDEGSTIARTTATYTTASLAVNATETGNITLAKGYTIYKIVTSVPARVRLYGTAVAQTADLSRALGVNSLPASTPMLEVKTETGYLTLSFAVNGASTETTPAATIPISVTNLNGSTAAVTVTVTYIALEA